VTPVKLLFVFGTRPEAIKLAPLVLAARAQPDRFQARVCVTAQHREMLDQVLALFGIVPEHDLRVMQSDQGLSEVTARVLTRLAPVLAEERPDWVLVQGDTTTCWTAALAAVYAGVRVAHVEAGLRTYDRRQPFPEEINRRLCAQLAELHLAPTEGARANLLAERTDPADVLVTGNTALDALRWVTERLDEIRTPELAALQAWAAEALGERRMVLVTGHRRESFGEGFRSICRALARLAGAYPDVHWVYPVHLNPRVQQAVRPALGGLPNVHLLDPLGYAPFVWLMRRAELVLTDSGGVQEEAPSLRKPVLVMRNTTERPEGVAAGLARLVGTSAESIEAGSRDVLEGRWVPADVPNPYGDGYASERILDAVAARGPQ
jgi:UDP-N-acetylglucosamine 2-epimerase (non-hydrolysing)